MPSSLLIPGDGIQLRSFVMCIICVAFIMSPEVSAQTVHYGDTVVLGSGVAFTWIETDAQSVPLRIGLSLTEAAVTNPASGLHSVDFPTVTSDSLFRHSLFAYEPNGHAPTGIYDLPHFDIHFYMITAGERQTIAGGNDPTPIPDIFMPEGYVTLPDMGVFSIPQMGVHFVDSLAGELHGQTFDKTLLYGFYQAKMIFVEPMITRAFLLTHPDTIFSIKQPDAYQRTAFYPESYVVRFNDQNSLYEIFITDFTLRTGVTSAGNSSDIPLNESFTLHQNYPNPFNPSTVIRFGILTESHVKIEIYNLLGELVGILADDVRPAGNHSISWTPDNGLSSGMYIYKMEANALSGSETFNAFKKMLLVR